MKLHWLAFPFVASFAEAFLVGVKPVTNLVELVKSQEGQHLDFSFTIDKGSKTNDRQMSLQGLKLTLTKDKSSATRLPGANGPSPQLSSGALLTDIDEQPFFVDLEGRQTVTFEDGCWEIVWKDTSPHGYLFCGFNLPSKVVRNGVSLPAGHIYICHHIWSPEGLRIVQDRKRKAEKNASDYLSKRKEAVLKMQETNNFFEKAVLYRTALAAMEDYSTSGISLLTHVPSSDVDTIDIGNNLVLSRKGKVFSMGNASFLELNKKVLGDSLLRIPG